MLQLRLTAKLQKEIGVKPDSLFEIGEGDTLLGNWYLHLFTLNRRKSIIFVNERTLYSFILYGFKKTNIAKIGEIFLVGLERALSEEKIPSNLIKRIRLEYYQVQFTKTDSKKVLGNMNDLVNLYVHNVNYYGGLQNCNLSEIIQNINRMPQKNIGWEYSINALRSLIGLEYVKKNML